MFPSKASSVSLFLLLGWWKADATLRVLPDWARSSGPGLRRQSGTELDLNATEIEMLPTTYVDGSDTSADSAPSAPFANEPTANVHLPVLRSNATSAIDGAMAMGSALISSVTTSVSAVLGHPASVEEPQPSGRVSVLRRDDTESIREKLRKRENHQSSVVSRIVGERPLIAAIVQKRTDWPDAATTDESADDKSAGLLTVTDQMSSASATATITLDVGNAAMSINEASATATASSESESETNGSWLSSVVASADTSITGDNNTHAVQYLPLVIPLNPAPASSALATEEALKVRTGVLRLALDRRQKAEREGLLGAEGGRRKNGLSTSRLGNRSRNDDEQHQQQQSPIIESLNSHTTAVTSSSSE